MHEFPSPDTFSDLILLAVREDVGTGDVTSELTVPIDVQGTGTLYQKASGVTCGLPIVEQVCRAFDPGLRVELLDGMEGKHNDGRLTPLMRIHGPMRSLLAAERTLLNFIQRMGGIATLTHRYVQRVAGTKAKILDTRKTLPGYRALDKYAVRVGGGHNHRIGLYDMVLVKDNHLAQMQQTPMDRQEWASRLERMVATSKQANPALPIEVEVVDVAQFQRVLAIPGVDIILLDNMDCGTMSRCVELRDEAKSAALLEASGGVSLDTVAQIARTGVDRISVGALTHSVSALDISLEIENA